MKELENMGIPFHFVDAKQHSVTLIKQIRYFKLKPPDIVLKGYKHDITNKNELIRWLIINSFDIIKKLKRYPSTTKKIIIIHGDAPPVLLGLLTKFLTNIILVHIEAGERTYNLFQPFPEEIIRRLADFISDIKFASSTTSFYNLKKERSLHKTIINIKENTLLDSLQLFTKTENPFSNEKYVLCSIHRYETITNYKKLNFITNILIQISKTMKIIFPLHQSTKFQLKKFNLLSKLLQAERVFLLDLQDYPHFISLIRDAEFLITDGGGPQQESSYLGIPCLLVRNVTERPEYKNIYLSDFSYPKVKYFIDHYENYRFKYTNKIKQSPSKTIAYFLKKIYNSQKP